MDNFISAYYIDKSICKEIIEYHRNNPNKVQGKTGAGEVNTYYKNSIDCHLEDYDLYKRYMVELQKCVDKYIDKYPFCNKAAPWRTVELPNIQQYIPPDGGFPNWHYERDRGEGEIGRRMLVYMTYLNDVTDEGETEFYHQEIRVQPEEGLTLIWPVDWTYTHRGNRSPTQEKFILTGWFNYTK